MGFSVLKPAWKSSVLIFCSTVNLLVTRPNPEATIQHIVLQGKCETGRLKRLELRTKITSLSPTHPSRASCKPQKCWFKSFRGLCVQTRGCVQVCREGQGGDLHDCVLKERFTQTVCINLDNLYSATNTNSNGHPSQIHIHKCTSSVNNAVTK